MIFSKVKVFQTQWVSFRTSTVYLHTCSFVTAEAHAVLSKHVCKHSHGTMAMSDINAMGQPHPCQFSYSLLPFPHLSLFVSSIPFLSHAYLCSFNVSLMTFWISSANQDSPPCFSVTLPSLLPVSLDSSWQLKLLLPMNLTNTWVTWAF